MPWNPSTLKRLRERRGLSQEMLAKRVGVTRVSIARLEGGNRLPRVDLLERLARELRVNVTALLR